MRDVCKNGNECSDPGSAFCFCAGDAQMQRAAEKLFEQRVEKLARFMCKACGHDPEALVIYFENAPKVKTPDGMLTMLGTVPCGPVWRAWRQIARIALEHQDAKP